MKILEQIDGLAANVTRMTIQRAKHFCDLYEAVYVVVCDFSNEYQKEIKGQQELEARMQEIRTLKNSITDYELGKAVTLSKALEVLGEN